MDVIHVVRQFAPAIGGLEDSVLNLARNQCRNLGLNAKVVTLNRMFGQSELLPRHEVIDDVPVARIAWRGSTRYPIAPSVLGEIRRADIVHVHAIDFFFDYLAVTRPIHRRKLVVSTHGGFFHSADYGHAKKLWFNSVTRLSATAYERIIACSENDAVMFAPVAGRRLRTIENGIDQTKFKNAASPVRNRTIVTFGRFARHKRIPALFDLLARLEASDPGWKLVVAGRDADQTTEELRSAADAAGVGAITRFVIAPSDSELRQVVGEASFYASASAHEGFGLAAVEALSAGLIPLLSSIPPFIRLISHGAPGLLFDPDAPDEAAQRIIDLNSTLDDAWPHARTAAIEMAASYDWASVAVAYMREYQSVLDGRRPIRTATTSRSR